MTQECNTKLLSVSEDGYRIWLTTEPGGFTSITAHDEELSLTHYMAEFDGNKYHIKNPVKFNDIYVKTAKKKPKIIRSLLMFHNNLQKEPDFFGDFKLTLGCFKRKIRIYIKRNFNIKKPLK